MLGQKRSGVLIGPDEVVSRDLSDTYSDSCREKVLAPCRELITPPTPFTQFNIKETTLAEIREAVRAARTSAVPGPSGVQYKVHKHCPRLLERLWRMIRVVWCRGRVAKQWRHVEGLWILKEENMSDNTQFSTMSTS